MLQDRVLSIVKTVGSSQLLKDGSRNEDCGGQKILRLARTAESLITLWRTARDRVEKDHLGRYETSQIPFIVPSHHSD